MMTQIVARNHGPITPSDTLANPADALYVGGAGTVTCVARGGGTATYTVPAGGQVPTNVTKVMATGTTATGIVALFL